jgi:hypothetical protein
MIRHADFMPPMPFHFFDIATAFIADSFSSFLRHDYFDVTPRHCRHDAAAAFYLLDSHITLMIILITLMLTEGHY